MKIRAYLAHPILGISGNKATLEEITFNIQRAIVAKKILEIVIPELEVYCPGEVDEFPQVALWDKKYLTLKQLLDIDCAILGKRDLLLIYNWQHKISDGMMIEKEYAQDEEHNIPTYTFTNINEQVFSDLQYIVDTLK